MAPRTSDMECLYLFAGDQRAEGIGKAAWQLEDAIEDRLVKRYPSSTKARDKHFEVVEAETDYRRALIGLLLLTIFETPAWCETDSDFFTYKAAHERCLDGPGEKVTVFLSDVPYIPPGWCVVLEIVLVLIIAHKLLLERRMQIMYFKPLNMTYANVKLLNFGLAMVVVDLLDCVFFTIWRPRWRLAFIARTGIFCLLPAVQNLSVCILAVIGEFVSVAVFLVGTIVFFAWIVVTIFDDMKDKDPATGKAINEGLDTFMNSLNSMFVAGVTEDFTQVFMPTYTAYRQAGLMWLLFLVIVQVLLLSLVLDTLVAAYTTFSETTQRDMCKGKINGILGAFDTLTKATADDGDCNAEDGAELEVTKESFLDFIKEFSRSPRMGAIPESTAEIIFKAVDKDASQLISKHEFCEICGVIQYKFWSTKVDSPVKDKFPRLWASGPFTRFRTMCQSTGEETSTFDGFMNNILLVNFVLVLVESYYDMNDFPEPPLMDRLELIFSLVYVAECSLKLCVWSWEQYISLRSNQFDFFTTYLLLTTGIMQEMQIAALSRYANILRLLRLLRVLKQLKNLPAVQFMVECILRLVLASRDILTMLGVVVYFFTTLGVQIWGGQLYQGNPDLEGTEYNEKRWFVLNFNDFLSAFGLWFVMLLCEYVQDFVEATGRTATMPYTNVVFLAFYVFCVSIVFELVKAFTIEVFVELHGEWGKEKEEEFEALEDMQKEFRDRGEMLHYRVIGDMSKQEKVHEALQDMLDDLREGSEGGGCDSVHADAQGAGHSEGHHAEPYGH